MKAAEPLQHEIPKAAVIASASKATLNPLQLKTAEVGGQMKQNPLRAVPYSQNPLQLLGEKQGQSNLDNPLQAQAQQLAKENKTGLPADLKANVEALSGISLDEVKVHYNSDKPVKLNALAFAQRTDIHVAPGQERHLPHEAWHVVQQKQNRVKPTMQIKKKINVNDDKGLEKEADMMGAKALPASSQLIDTKSNDLQDSNIIYKASLNSYLPIGKGLTTSQSDVYSNSSQSHPKAIATTDVIQMKWHTVKKQPGEFEGDPKYHHLHRVGGTEHYRYGTSPNRVFYILDNKVKYDSLQRAIEECEIPRQDNSGKEECLQYLQALLAVTPAPAPVKAEPKAPPPKKEDPPKRGASGRKKLNIKLKEGDDLDAYTMR